MIVGLICFPLDFSLSLPCVDYDHTGELCMP